ncbi:MAG: type I restriction endonuclease subunit R [Phycisphaera sp. RhM]|nr:type I restriction endonuclease subunit R [Phycisphaera sp. RhM]
MINEDQLEQLSLNWFQDAGWEYANGVDISPDGDVPERDDYRVVVLKDRLTDAVARLNPDLSRSAVDEVVHIVTHMDHPSLLQRNRELHRLYTNGVKVEYSTHDADGHDVKETIYAQIIDFQHPDNNDLLVVNQYSVKGTKQTRRPDVVIFVNGLPLAVIELKNPADQSADVWKAYSQLQTYKDEISDLMAYNVALVISDGFNARVGSLTANQERFMPWNVVKNEDDRPLLEYQLEKVVRGFFDPELFLDYMRYFVLFEDDGDKLIKKIAGYHQFHGVREAVRVTTIAAADTDDGVVRERRATYGAEVQPGSRKAGVFWHTQGSGKSISMACYAGKLLQQPEMKNPTLVVVTDRNELDGQLYQQFCMAKDLLKQTPEQANSRDELRDMLASRESGGIIFTTVQKFSLLDNEDEHPLLCNRSNVVVISDEAHRSQYGLKARLKQIKDKETGEVVDAKYVFGFAKHMRDALPNASFIGFTGTPIDKEDKDTRGVFGDYVSIYDIQDAVDDGATVPIYYESRLVKIDINRAAIDELNKHVEEVIEDEEDVEAREKTKSRWTQLRELVGAKERLAEIAADVVAHFEKRTASVEGKAMFVGMSRQICVDLFAEIIKLRPEWEGTKITNDEGKEVGYNHEDGAIRIIMTGSATDKSDIQQHVYTGRAKKRLEKRFKDPNDPLKVVIVRDMWLTGFDAPCCHTMYVDKPMSGHNLMQAIARVNRVFKDKPGGLVVDYIGIGSELKAALKTYTDAKGKGQPTLKAEEALRVLHEKMDAVRGLFHGFDYSGYRDNALVLLPPAANHILGLEKQNDKTGKQRFLDIMASISKAYSLCSTLDEAKPYHLEIAFLSAVRAAIVKNTTVDQKLVQDQKNSAMKQILDNAVVSEGVVDVFSLANLDKPNIGLLSDEFLEDVRNMPLKNLAVELLEKLLRDEIRSRSARNVVQEKAYTDRLIATLRKYHNRSIETAQVIEELIAMAKDFQARLKRDEELGLSGDEVAFYDALANNESAVRELGDEILKKIAVEITEKLKASTTVDWRERDSVRARLRNLVRVLLRRYKYPPEDAPAAIELVMKQAEALAEGWSREEL